ncbi:putative immunoglobulin-blocking virulence protein [Mycoplasmopsis cynos]|nr:putative immunoglobulin-blocking virulence protein [Mycoplasmopsis cynos]
MTSYRIINIGRNNANQSFINIFKALPDKIPQLELFFETHNTTSLIALEDKEIDELSLYTTGNSNAGGWSINPWALKKTRLWVNMIDYNVSFDYKPGLRVATRLGFDDIAFEDSDFDGKDFSRINNGIRMVYWVRNNERVFQGGLGAGLKPDRNEGENSYPVEAWFK